MGYIIGICDDHASQVALVKRYLFHCPSQQVFTIIESTEPEEFIKLVKATEPHVVFLDIDMGEHNGIDLGRRIRDYYINTVIIYITSYEKYAVDAFEIRAFHYLLKPFTSEKFNKVMSEALDYLDQHSRKKEKKKYTVKTKKEVSCIEYEDIYYFEKIGRQVKICTKERDVYCYNSFINLLEEIDLECFVRCHQGYIVNIDKIKRFQNKKLFLCEDFELPVSRAYVENVRLILAKTLFVGRD